MFLDVLWFVRIIVCNIFGFFSLWLRLFFLRFFDVEWVYFSHLSSKVWFFGIAVV